MYNFYPMILGVTEKLNELNDKLNAWLGDKTDNVFVGAAIFGILVVIAFAGVNALNKDK